MDSGIGDRKSSGGDLAKQGNGIGQKTPTKLATSGLRSRCRSLASSSGCASRPPMRGPLRAATSSGWPSARGPERFFLDDRTSNSVERDGGVEMPRAWEEGRLECGNQELEILGSARCRARLQARPQRLSRRLKTALQRNRARGNHDHDPLRRLHASFQWLLQVRQRLCSGQGKVKVQ